ncbi:MAG TPA: type II toxin-antitoxin system VapC family toxin [Candidatus Saccharimonadia bacterium]|nr:type II toxin-antitoxin system VapC family toxin [Candidatus Saccharimonadia bacterium]
MASSVLVDTNVLLDILTADPIWCQWSAAALQQARATGPIIINAIVCAEIAPAFNFDWQKLDTWLLPSSFVREDLPFPASVVAASAHQAYRQRGGKKETPLPDFYIGAHAQIAGHTLLTRDASRYRTYFSAVPLIAPAP